MDEKNFDDQPFARTAGSAWMSRRDSAHTPEIPAGGLALNVRERRVSSVVGGFGQLWEKKYSVNLSDAAVTPQQVIQAWKRKFAAFWPAGNRFFGPSAEISPGEIAVLNLAGPGGINAPGGLPIIATGIQVVYTDDTSFAFLPLEGHMLCGIITFRSFAEAGTTAQVHVLVRTGDPLYELTYWLGFGHAMEDTFWEETLTNLAAHFGSAGKPQVHAECVDKRLQWKGFSNIWKNAAVRTGLYILVSPLRWIKKALMIK
jgi:hypothetical protein